MRLGEVDPWMLTHLRLARARGSLQCPNSRVQDRALEILDMVDESAKENARVDMVKALLAQVGLERQDLVVEQFPEYFKRDPFEVAYDEATGEFDIDKVDPSAVEWQVPDEAEDADLSAWIAQQERANGGVTTFTADDDGWT